ncbi:MAG: sensor histidine kinase [Actinoallomurus sp.]
MSASASSMAGHLRSLAGRWRSPGAVVRDREIALILAVLAFVPALSKMSAQFGDLPPRHATALTVVLTLGLTLPLAVRTQWPAACLAVVGVAFAVHESLGYPPTVGSLGLYLALYAAGAHQGRFQRVLALAATGAYVVLSIALHALGSPDRLPDFVLFYLALTLFWVVGAYVRRRRAEEAERRRLSALAATAAERTRIARELHDVVTHHVTAMVVQADAAQFLTESPGRVVAGLTTISGTGRRALSELRYLLGVLEATGESTPAERTPALGTLRDLVEQTRLGGQPIELVEQGERPPMSVGVELAAYRVVQETLTNAVKYAGGHGTVVRVGYAPDRIDLDVTTEGPPPAAPSPVRAEPGPPGGRGLGGLRERVALLGGSLEAGPRPGGGFRVCAWIPTGDAG